MDPAPKISVYTILSPFEHWATLSCQSVSSKPHRLTTHKVLYDWVKITLPSIGSGSTKPFFPVMYFLSHNCTKTRKTPLSELLLVAVLSVFILFLWGLVTLGVPAVTLWSSKNTLKTCWDTLGIDISGVTWGKITDLLVTWRHGWLPIGLAQSVQLL